MGAEAFGPVIACEVFRDELEVLAPGREIIYLEQGLHRMPERLHESLADAIAGLEKDAAPESITLVYGLCGGALAGLRAQRAELVAARVHDCLGLLLGKQPEVTEPGCKGCFYLSPGWVLHSRHPLLLHEDLVERFDQEQADWVCAELYKGYGTLALIDTVPAPAQVENVWRATGAAFGLELVRVKGDLSMLERLLAGREGPDIAVLKPGRAIDSDLFGLPPGIFGQTSP